MSKTKIEQTYGRPRTGGAISGLKTVTAAGAAEALGTLAMQCAVMVKALTTNTGLVYVGNDGANDVASTSGMPLSAGDSIVYPYLESLACLYVDSAVNSEGVAWAALEVF